MANLAEAIQGLVQHMRSEQQMIRNWADAQAEQHGEIKRLLEVLARERDARLSTIPNSREKDHARKKSCAVRI